MKKIMLFSVVVLILSPGLLMADQVQKETKKPVKVEFCGVESVDTFKITYSHYRPWGHEQKKRHGSAVSIKARVRPFRINDFDLGFYASYANGVGRAYRSDIVHTTHADYTTWGGGLSGIYNYTRDIEFGAEFGLLHQKTDIWVPEKNFTGHQDDWMREYRLSYDNETRREEGEEWFPEHSLYIHYVDPYSTSYSDSRGRGDEYAYDNRRFTVGGEVDIYDWYFSGTSDWRLTPTFNANLGYIWGKESGFFQGGFGTKLGYYKDSIFDFNFLNPRWMFEGDGSRLLDFVGTWHAGNSFYALRAASMKRVPARHVHASKDYLLKLHEQCNLSGVIE